MREDLFWEQAIAHEAVIQHKWRLLVDWMGHSSIEQRALTIYIRLICWQLIRFTMRHECCFDLGKLSSES